MSLVLGEKNHEERIENIRKLIMIAPDMERNAHYDLFIFDFDGTLADSRKNIVNSLNFALAQQHLEVIDEQRVFPLIGKLSLEATFLFFYPNLNVSQLASLLVDFRRYQKEHAEQELVFYPEVFSTLQALKDQEKLLAILTTKNFQQIVAILETFHVSHLFDVVLGEGVIEQRKPEKESVEYILSALPTKVEKTKTVMIGDSEVDVLTAQNAAIAMIAVGHGTDSLEFLEQKGSTFSVHSFAEILQFA